MGAQKFIVALIGAVLIILNLVLPVVHGQAKDIITAVIAVLSSVTVYAVPNTVTRTTAPVVTK